MSALSYLYVPFDNVSKPLLTLLAANIKKIEILPKGERRIDAPEFTPFYRRSCLYGTIHCLQELDVSGVHSGTITDGLVALLPNCPYLKSLKLGRNATPSVFRAAKACPLEVFHMGVSRIANPIMQQEMLLSAFMGSKLLNLKEIKRNCEKGIYPDVEPLWPNLVDISIGCYAESFFFVLALIVFRKLRYLSNDRNILDPNIFIDYMKIRRRNKYLPILALRKLTLASSFIFSKEFKSIPDLEKVVMLTHKRSVDSIYCDLSNLAAAKVQLKELHLVHLEKCFTGRVAQEHFTRIGGNVRLLELHGWWGATIDLIDVGDLIKHFPVLKELKVSFGHGLTSPHESNLKNYKFPNVSSISLRTDNLSEHAIRSVAEMFPRTKMFKLTTRMSCVPHLLLDLRNFSELRILKLNTLFNVDLLELCTFPRPITDGHCWELHSSPDDVSERGMKMIMASEWNFFPISEHNFNMNETV